MHTPSASAELVCSLSACMRARWCGRCSTASGAQRRCAAAAAERAACVACTALQPIEVQLRCLVSSLTRYVARSSATSPDTMLTTPVYGRGCPGWLRVTHSWPARVVRPPHARERARSETGAAVIGSGELQGRAESDHSPAPTAAPTASLPSGRSGGSAAGLPTLPFTCRHAV